MRSASRSGRRSIRIRLRTERLAKRILQSAFCDCVQLAVVVVIGTVQSIARFVLRRRSYRPCGYSSGTCRFRRDCGGLLQSLRRGAPFSDLAGEALLPSVTLGLWLAAVFGWLIPQHAALPLAAFACAATGRLLQRMEIRLVWFAGKRCRCSSRALFGH